MWLFCILLLVFAVGTMGSFSIPHDLTELEPLSWSNESNISYADALWERGAKYRDLRRRHFQSNLSESVTPTVTLMIIAASACLLLAITGCLLSQPISLWCAGKRARARVAVAAASDDGVTVLASHARPSDPRHRATRGIAFDVTARSSHDVCVQSLRLAGDLGKVCVFVLDGEVPFTSATPGSSSSSTREIERGRIM